MVMPLAYGTVGANPSSFLSSESFPSSTNWSTAVATKVSVMLPIRTRSDVFIARPVLMSALPFVRTQSPPDVHTPEITPGVFVSATALSTAAFSLCCVASLSDPHETQATRQARSSTCLLYTSDAADDLLCVDLGGR